MTKKKKEDNQYSDVTRPNIWFTVDENLALEDYINSLKQKKKMKIYKSEFVKKAIFYCIKNKIDPFE